MLGANLRFGGATSSSTNGTHNVTKVYQCHPGGTTEASVVFSLGGLGMAANIVLMCLILSKRNLRRWSQGLMFHQALVDCARAAILIPLGMSILKCQPIQQCGLLETSFLLLVTVSTINMLTTVLNDAPVLPDDSDESTFPFLMDSPQCVLFGTFIIWFASITINLGPTFLSGALVSRVEGGAVATCPLVSGPFRHYVLNVLWILINVVCVLLTLYHLYKLYRDITKSSMEAVRIASLVTTMVSVGHHSEPETPEHRRVRGYIQQMERDGIQRVKMFIVITVAYIVFWGPLFIVTLLESSSTMPSMTHEVTLHVAFVHAFVNPTLFLVLHKGLRRAVTDLFCCSCVFHDDLRSVPPFPPDEDITFSSFAAVNRNYIHHDKGQITKRS